MPLPDFTDIARLPASAQEAVYGPRARWFNQQRVAAAQDARDRMAPKRSDYAGAGNVATQNAEYQAAVDAYNNDPYVKELDRIIAEGTEHPDEIPSYLTQNTSASAPHTISVGEMRTTLGHLGINIPANASPEQIQAGFELLGTIPEELLGPIMAPGTQVSFESPIYGKSTPSFIPVRAGGDVSVSTSTGLSDVTTGVDFQQTQTYEATVQVQANVTGEVGRTPINGYYKTAGQVEKAAGKLDSWGIWSNNLQTVSNPEVKKLLDSSPLMKYVVKGLPIPSGTVQRFEGERLQYEAVVTPEQGKRIAAGDLSAGPNPLDPLNMPSGTSVLIRGENLQGTAFEAAYKVFNVSGSVTNLEGQGFGVRKLDGPIVEVYAGPVESLENSAFIGLGKGSVSIGVAADTSLETQKMSVARIDLSTAEGQAAYQQFMSTGQVPHWSPPGVQAAGTSEIFNGEKAVTVAANFGPVSVGFGNSSQLSVTRTTWEDGTITQQNTYASNVDHTADVTTKIGPDGEPIESETQWTLVMGNNDPTRTSYLNDAYSQTGKSSYGKFDGPQHVQLKFNADELMGLRSQARSTLPPERLKDLDADPSRATTPVEMIAAAKSPGDVFHVLSMSDPGEVAMTLGSLRGSTHQPVPGQLKIQDAG